MPKSRGAVATLTVAASAGWHLERGTVRLVSRKGNNVQTSPALCRSLGACLIVTDAVLDGEIVYLGQDGKPLFYDLMRRRGPQYFSAFDLLWLNGHERRGLPLLERSADCGRSCRPRRRRCCTWTTSSAPAWICSALPAGMT